MPLPIEPSRNCEPLQPLTFDELLTRCMGQLDFAQKVLRDFIEQTGPQIDEISADLDNSLFDDAARKIHRLKGTAATLAAKPLFHSLVDIEELLKSTDDPASLDQSVSPQN